MRNTYNTDEVFKRAAEKAEAGGMVKHDWKDMKSVLKREGFAYKKKRRKLPFVIGGFLILAGLVAGIWVFTDEYKIVRKDALAEYQQQNNGSQEDSKERSLNDQPGHWDSEADHQQSETNKSNQEAKNQLADNTNTSDSEVSALENNFSDQSATNQRSQQQRNTSTEAVQSYTDDQADAGTSMQNSSFGNANTVIPNLTESTQADYSNETVQNVNQDEGVGSDNDPLLNHASLTNTEQNKDGSVKENKSNNDLTETNQLTDTPEEVTDAQIPLGEILLMDSIPEVDSNEVKNNPTGNNENTEDKKRRSTKGTRFWVGPEVAMLNSDFWTSVNNPIGDQILAIDSNIVDAKSTNLSLGMSVNYKFLDKGDYMLESGIFFSQRTPLKFTYNINSDSSNATAKYDFSGRYIDIPLGYKSAHYFRKKGKLSGYIGAGVMFHINAPFGPKSTYTYTEAEKETVKLTLRPGSLGASWMISSGLNYDIAKDKKIYLGYRFGNSWTPVVQHPDFEMPIKHRYSSFRIEAGLLFNLKKREQYVVSKGK